MREFTQAEKQQLQTKIDNQERKQRIVGDIIRKNREAKRTGPIGTVWKYGFLAIILCLVGFNVIVFVWARQYISVQRITIMNLVVVSILLLNHIAFYFTKKGKLSLVMKSVAFTVSILGLVYVACVCWLTARAA